MMKKTCLAMLAVSILLVMMSCTTAGLIPSQDRSAKHVLVLPEGMRITDAEGSFEFVGGEIYETPFSSPSLSLDIHTDSGDLFGVYAKAVETMGARPVIIDYPGREDPIYGILMISKLFPHVVGPAATSYQISVEQSVVDKLSGGNIVAVWETYNVSEPGLYAYKGTPIHPKSWVLWMSNVPLW